MKRRAHSDQISIPLLEDPQSKYPYLFLKRALRAHRRYPLLRQSQGNFAKKFAGLVAVDNGTCAACQCYQCLPMSPHTNCILPFFRLMLRHPALLQAPSPLNSTASCRMRILLNCELHSIHTYVHAHIHIASTEHVHIQIYARIDNTCLQGSMIWA